MECKILSQSSIELNEISETLQLPLVIKDRVLLSPGVWNGLTFTAEEIKKGFDTTDWTKKENYALIYDHDERAVNWLGNVVNLRYLEDGALVGDLEIFDENLALKLTKGAAKLGISAKLLGMEDEEGAFVNFSFNNFSVVYEPACKNAYINLSQNKLLDKIRELEERIKELEGETGAGDTSGAKIDSAKSNSKIKYGKKKKKMEESDLETLKGGQENLVENMEKENPTQAEEVVETVEAEPTEEAPVEEAVEESKEAEEAPAEEAVAEVAEEEEEAEEPVEESKEELSSKMDKIISMLDAFDKRVAKLEEAEPEAEAEEVAEEVAEEAPVEEKAELSEEAEEKSEGKSLVQLKTQSRHALLGNAYTAGELKLAKTLYDNAKRT